MASDIPQTPFVKQLAANDRPTRDKALLSLRTYLSGRRDLPPLELLKLWKGLFYCMWMSDRPRPQQQLASDLASLVFVLPPATTIPFLRAFWQTMQREWTNIDVLRMEKFLLLTRRYLGATFQVLQKAEWERGLVQEHMELLGEMPCNAKDMRMPNGMRFHVIDIYVDELEKVGALAEDDGVPLDLLLDPIQKMAQGSSTKPVRVKAKEALEDERLPGNKRLQYEEAKSSLDDEWGGIQD